MKSLYLLIAIVVTATAGTLVGVYGGMRMTHKRVDRIVDRAPDRILQHMTSQLDLNENQRRAFDEIVFGVHTQIVMLHEAFAPKIEAAMEGAFDQIGELLRPEQISKLEQEIKIFEQHQSEVRPARHPVDGLPPPPSSKDGGDPRFEGPPPSAFDANPPPMHPAPEAPNIIISNLIIRLEQLQIENLPTSEKMQKLQSLLRPPMDRRLPPAAMNNGPMGADIPSARRLPPAAMNNGPMGADIPSAQLLPPAAPDNAPMDADMLREALQDLELALK